MSTGRRGTADEKKLLDSARRCKDSAIATLAKSGKVNLNVADENGSTAVHFSCKAADLSSLGILLEHGARTDVFDKSGKTPMHYAAEKDYVETLALLVAYRGDVDLKNKKTGKTALHYACESNKIRALKFLLFCGADFRLPDNNDRCPDIGSKQVQGNLDIQQAFKDRKIITFGKMMQRKEKHVFSQVKFTLENTNTDAKEFSFFCRTMPIECMHTDTVFPCKLSKCLQRPDIEAVSDVYGYVVNQRVTDIIVTVPIYSTPDKFDNIFVEDSKGSEYTCQEIKHTKENSFLVVRMTFEVDEDNFMSFVILKKRKTDKYTVSGSEQTMASSVENKFLLCLPAKCLPKASSVELKVYPTDGFPLNTEYITSTSIFCDIRTEHTLRKPVILFLPCPTRTDSHDTPDVLVYNAKDEGITWVEVDAEVVDTGDAVKVLDKSICNGTFIVTEVTKKQPKPKNASSWIKNFLKWLYSNVITRTKSCLFMAITKPVTEHKFKVLVLLTDEKTSQDFLDKWKKESYITQMAQKTSAYLYRPGKVFTAKVDTKLHSVLGRSSLELCYQSGRESHQEFIVNGKEHDIVMVYISKRETKKSPIDKLEGDILTQINVELIKQITDEPRVVGHKFDEYPDDTFLSWLADELGYEWSMVGVSLGYKYSYLESIERGNTPRRTNLTMLYTWREDNDKSSDIGLTILLHSLANVGRRDLVTEINKQVGILIENSPTKRICKWIEGHPDNKTHQAGTVDEVDGVPLNSGSVDNELCVSCLIGEPGVVSPFEETFLLTIVNVIHFNIYVLHQLNVLQDRIDAIKHTISDSTAAMFKCLILAKRGYRDEATFFDDLLNGLKHDKNNQAISDIKQTCMNWLKGRKGPFDKKAKKLEDILRSWLNDLNTVNQPNENEEMRISMSDE